MHETLKPTSPKWIERLLTSGNFSRIKALDQDFDGTVSAESTWVLGAGFQNLAGALLPTFEGELKMRVRAVDVHGNCSDWVDLK